MLSSGWKKKAEKLRLIILSVRIEQPLSLEMAEIFEGMRQFRKEQIDAAQLEAKYRELESRQSSEPRWMWEPFSDMRGEPQSVYGWTINATMCQLNGQNWWLVRAERMPSDKLADKDVVMLGRVLDVLGGHIEHDALSVGDLEDNVRAGVPFMWTWFNQAPLYEIQTNKDKKKPKEMIRIVPLGAAESDGYTRLDHTAIADEDGGAT